jgi:hypothetical protein
MSLTSFRSFMSFMSLYQDCAVPWVDGFHCEAYAVLK